MASTEEARQHPLGAQHLAGCLKLSAAAHWNQNEADWRLMLELGRGWGLTEADGTLAATTIVLPYGEQFAWVSMVLVLPAYRRKGYASRLLGVAIDDLRQHGLTPLLDATPAGHEVYVQEGFRDTWGFRRYQRGEGPIGRSQRPSGMATGVRPLEAADWPGILALDGPAFGARREPLLRALARRLPQAAWVCEREGRIAGYLLGRDGREARQLGPLVATHASIAEALLAEALANVPAPVYLDVANQAGALVEWLQTRGFVLQRPFTRMVYGADRAPGEVRAVFLVAGPELG